MPSSTSLESSLARLDRIIEDACTERSHLGVFPAMYRRVTAAVLEAIRAGGFFDDDELVEHLTVVFADLYFEAYDLHRSNEPAAGCWVVAFETAEAPQPRMILQHLLLGMNAHINLDLGLAAWKVGSNPEHLRADFLRVNEVLFQVLDSIQAGMGEVSPRMKLIDRLGGPWDERLMRVGIRTCRDLAWGFALELAEAEDPPGQISRRDAEATWVARAMTRKLSPVSLVAGVVARAENRDIVDIVEAIGRGQVDFEAADRAVTAQRAADTGASFPSLYAAARRSTTVRPGGRGFRRTMS